MGLGGCAFLLLFAWYVPSHLPLKSLNFKEIRTRAELEDSPGKEIKICGASSTMVRTLVLILKAAVPVRANNEVGQCALSSEPFYNMEYMNKKDPEKHTGLKTNKVHRKNKNDNG